MEKMPASLPAVNALLKWLEDKKPLDEGFKENVHSTFQIFVVMARSSEYGSCFRIEDTRFGRDGSKILKVSPIEFITSALLIHQHKRKLTLPQLTEAVRKMRIHVRTKEQDIRANSRVSRPMITFIKELKVTQLKSDKGKPAAVTGVELYERGPSRKEDGEVTATKKRSRADASDDEYFEPRKPESSTSQRTTRAKNARSPSPKLLSPVVKAPPSPEAPARLLSSPQTTHHPPPSSQANQLPLQNPNVSQSFSYIPSQPQPPPPEPVRPVGPPRIHPDRLAAIRAARSSDPPRMSRADIPVSSVVPNPPPDKGWQSVGMRMGSGPMGLHPAPTQPPSSYDSLSQSLMSRMQMSYTPGPTHRVDYRNQPPASDPYDPRQHSPHPQRDSYSRQQNSGGQWATQGW